VTGKEEAEMELRDRVAIVTGAGGGIGKGIALCFAREGATVIVNDVNLDNATKVAGQIISMGNKALPLRANVAIKAEVEAMVGETLNRFGTIDILVNNAGIGGAYCASVKDIPEEAWDQTMAVNMKGAFLCCQAVIPTMIERRKGKILNVSSLAAHRMGFFTGADYSASKAGLLGFSHHLAHELAIYRINVNVLCPGFTVSHMTVTHSTEELREYLAKTLPLGTWCSPEDQAEAALFLVSDRAAMITGHVMDVDSGQLLGWGNYLEDIERRRNPKADQ
jgi:NAD(P)-dependent dehydrogenase (short-subunit alcohol dehydrogenase family)